MSAFTPAELEARRQVLGASEIGSVLGLSPYLSAFELWLDKRGLREAKPGTPWQAWGLKTEPLIAEAYVEAMLERTGQVLTLTGDGRTPVRLTGTPWACTPDRLVDDHATGGRWGLDCKQSRYGQGYGQVGTAEVPPHVYAQCQWSCLVTGLERWDVACLIGGSEFRLFHVERDPAFLAHALTEAEAFWQHVTDGTEPPMDGSRAARDYLAQRYPEDLPADPLPVDDSDATVALLTELAGCKRERDQLDSRIGAIENQVKARLGDLPGADTPAGRVTWKKTKDSTTCDWEGLARTLGATPAEIASFSSIRPGVRRFLFRPAAALTPAED